MAYVDHLKVLRDFRSLKPGSARPNDFNDGAVCPHGRMRENLRTVSLEGLFLFYFIFFFFGCWGMGRMEDGEFFLQLKFLPFLP